MFTRANDPDKPTDPVHRHRATAEECLQHPWLQLPPTPKEAEAAGDSASGQACSVLPAISESGEGVEGPVSEELIVMAAYTLGQCRQSDKESITPDPKAISKRFKFEEPFGSLQEVPGEFIF